MVPVSTDSRPAIVIYGVVLEYDFLANLDINDAKYFEVLKGVSSVVIYSLEGSNGVIITTTMLVNQERQNLATMPILD